MINALIIKTLAPLGVPVEPRRYSGTEDTYITFFTYSERGEDWAENKEIAKSTSVQVDIWSKTDYSDLSDNVKKLMIDAGFKRTFIYDMPFEPDTKIYHRTLRFTYYE